MGLTNRWRKSSRSGAQGNCVEARVETDVEVRDSKDRGGPVLTFSPQAWREFIADVKVGNYDV